MYQMINISNWILQHLFYIHITITYIQDAQHRSLFTGPDPNAEWLPDGCCPAARPPPCLAATGPPPAEQGRREHRRSRAGGRSTLLRGSAATPRGPCPTCAPHRCRRAALLRCRRRSGLPP